MASGRMKHAIHGSARRLGIYQTERDTRSPLNWRFGHHAGNWAGSSLIEWGAGVLAVGSFSVKVDYIENEASPPMCQHPYLLAHDRHGSTPYLYA